MFEHPTISGWRPFILIFLLFQFATFFFFSPGLFGDYAYDSNIVLQLGRPGSPVHDFSDIFSITNYSDRVGVLSWRPLTIGIYYLFDHTLFGYLAFLSHIFDFIIHGTNGFLIWLLLYRRFRLDIRTSVPAALFFLLHPLTTEVVYCTGFRGDSLALCLTISAVLVGTTKRTDFMSLCAFTPLLLAGLAAKEIAIVAVVLAPLSALLLGLSRRALLLTVTGLAVSVLFLWVWSMFKYEDYPSEFLGGGGRFLGMINFLISAREIYLPALVLPITLRIDHEFVPATDPLGMRAIGAVLVIGLLVISLGSLAWRHRSSHPVMALGLVWVCAGFAPLSQLIAVPDPVAERFCYVPLAGVSLLLAPALERLGRRRWAMVAVAGLLLVCGARTAVRGLDWRDDVTLNIANWEASPKRTERSATSLAALYLAASSEPGDGVAELEKARVELDFLAADFPQSAEGWRLRAIYHLRRREVSDAQAALLKALETGASREELAPIADRMFQTP